MKTNIIFLIVLISLLSCEQKNDKNVPNTKITAITDSTYIYNEYYKDGSLKLKGEYLNNKKNGLWIIYDSLGNHKETIEYFIVKDSSVINQKWMFNNKGDTLTGVGNHYSLIMSNEVELNKILRIHLSLLQPIFSFDSEAYLLIDNKNQLKSRFSNLKSIKWDTVKSLSDLFPNDEKLSSRKHDFVFDIKPSSQGKKELNMILVEKLVSSQDSADYKTREIYISEHYDVR
jgi:hypothetical protein